MTQPSQRESEGSSPSGQGALVVGTLNVRTLKGKMAQALTLARENSLDILCLQEVRLSEDNMLSAHHAAKQQGWTFLPGPCAQDSQGAPTAGVAVLSRWPVEKKALPSQIDPELQCHSGRWQVLQVHRPARRPFVLVNLYLHASDRSSACRLGHLLFELTAQMGEDCLFIGDWNNVPDEEPALSPLRGGRLHLADEIAGLCSSRRPLALGVSTLITLCIPCC